MHYEYNPSWRLKESVHARIQNVLLDGIQFLPPSWSAHAVREQTRWKTYIIRK